MGRELWVALLIGVTMSLGVALLAWYRAPEVLVVVCLTMTLIVLVGSAPLITSLADISGVLIYFSIAT